MYTVTKYRASNVDATRFCSREVCHAHSVTTHRRTRCRVLSIKDGLPAVCTGGLYGFNSVAHGYVPERSASLEKDMFPHLLNLDSTHRND
jgi:hypothetical protein